MRVRREPSTEGDNNREEGWVWACAFAYFSWNIFSLFMYRSFIELGFESWFLWPIRIWFIRSLDKIGFPQIKQRHWPGISGGICLFQHILWIINIWIEHKPHFPLNIYRRYKYRKMMLMRDLKLARSRDQRLHIHKWISEAIVGSTYEENTQSN